jgi:hypothetical protein
MQKLPSCAEEAYIRVIKSPDYAVFEQCARAFEARSGIPGIIRAIGGSHIFIAPPKRQQKSYYSRK